MVARDCVISHPLFVLHRRLIFLVQMAMATSKMQGLDPASKWHARVLGKEYVGFMASCVRPAVCSGGAHNCLGVVSTVLRAPDSCASCKRSNGF